MSGADSSHRSESTSSKSPNIEQQICTLVAELENITTDTKIDIKSEIIKYKMNNLQFTI